VSERPSRWRFYASLPERAVRIAAATLGGTLHETLELTLPRVVRRSRFYEATAKNLLRVVIELLGGVEGSPTEDPKADAVEIAKRKGAGNIVELGSIAAFGFSPLWLLAGAADVTHGSRVYLNALTQELKAAGVIDQDVDAGSVDELLSVLERTSGGTARLIDIPPLDLEALRESLDELRSQPASLPSAEEQAAVYVGLRRTADAEGRTLLDVSTGVGLAFLIAARRVSATHIAAPYREDWQPVRDEGFAAYARRVADPYRRAVAAHADTKKPARTERLLERFLPWRGRKRTSS
jgi:hypothetical protein